MADLRLFGDLPNSFAWFVLHTESNEGSNPTALCTAKTPQLHSAVWHVH